MSSVDSISTELGRKHFNGCWLSFKESFTVQVKVFYPLFQSQVIVSKWGQYVTQVDDKEGLDDDTSNDVKFTLDRRTFDESKRKRIHPDRVVRYKQIHPTELCYCLI